MKKLILASVSAIALLGIAACSDTDSTTTQGVEPPMETTPTVPSDPSIQPAPAPEAAPEAPADDSTMQPAEPAPAN